MDIYECNEVKELRLLISEELPLLHTPIYVIKYIDRIAEKIKTAMSEQNPVLCTLVKNHMTHIAFENITDLCLKSSQISTHELAARMHGFVSYSDIDIDARINPQLQLGIDHLLFSPTVLFHDYIRDQLAYLGSQSAFGHGAGLVHYLSSNGVEIYRQVVPIDIVDRVEILKSFGFDFSLSHNIYGGDCPLLALIETSVHPYAAGVGAALLTAVS